MNTIKATDAEQKLRLGMEYFYNDLITIRSGYKFGLDEESWSLGGGLKMIISNFKLSIDYAYADFGILGSRNLFTLGLSF